MSYSIDFIMDNGRPRKRLSTIGGPDVQIVDLGPADFESERFKRWTAGLPLGTPIEELVGRAWVGGKVTDQMCAEWKAVHAVYVEDLAAVLDNATGIGMKSAARKLATDYLTERAAKAADAKKPKASTDERLDTIEKKLEAVLEMLKKNGGTHEPESRESFSQRR